MEVAYSTTEETWTIHVGMLAAGAPRGRGRGVGGKGKVGCWSEGEGEVLAGGERSTMKAPEPTFSTKTELSAWNSKSREVWICDVNDKNICHILYFI